MKTTSNMRLSSNILMTVAVSTYLVSPFTVNAMTSVQPTNQCTKVQSFGQNALANIQTRLNKVNSDAQSDATKRLTEEQSFDAKVAADWAKWDTIRQQNFTALNNKATTSSEKAAVATFEQTVLTAVSDRRDAVTNARNTFRGTVESDATARLNEVDGAVSTFQTAVSTAVSKAEANCSTETTATLRNDFVSSLKSARTSFQSALVNLPKLTTEVQSASQLRTSAVQSADNSFKQTVQDAANALKKTLGQTS
jgi:hypothetical protein